uniref:Enoyl reductase (ER) domain-containing protein n=1 Tax=Pseudictyota dubia TaxID=2749911 RepID=A0A7R9VYS2_9STRA|mmetsp:Transcript_26884/g.49801  ORF Transcript_26884/g.49801 Transcript_26884/m.49801 type:complete len:393 (+) Transcript_26884:338-1516(+)
MVTPAPLHLALSAIHSPHITLSFCSLRRGITAPIQNSDMRALAISKIGPIAPVPKSEGKGHFERHQDRDEGPLAFMRFPIPAPTADQVLIKVSCCGVCHTELDEIEGRTTPPYLPVIPGHEIVGHVVELGPDVKDLRMGDRVGVGWIFDSDGTELENLSPAFRATGRDANGGYAEYMIVGEHYAHRIPDVFTDEEAAPLLCAGGIGYRALKLTGFKDKKTLGLMGFGGSAHIVLQLAKHIYPNSKIFVFARSQATRDFALELGADWAGNTSDMPPEKLDAIIDTTPAWAPILASLEVLKPGGRLVINAIRKESKDVALLANLDYAHHIWMEKEIKTVANVTGKDLREFLKVAAEIPLQPKVTIFPLEDANVALRALKAGNIQGAYVLKVGRD